MESILWVQHTADARKLQLERGAGTITTYRKGTKWLRPELIGQEVQFVNCHKFHQPPCGPDCEVFGVGIVLAVKACRFADIDDIDHQRQSSDMGINERLRVMQSVYGEYDGNTITTVITLAMKHSQD